MEGNSIDSYKNLCKIFEMRIKIDKEKKKEISSDVLNNYEKYLLKIDSYYNSLFEKNIKSLISTESSLEKEEKRLKKLIELLEDRINERDEIENRYHETTGKKLMNLQMIISDMEFNNKKERLAVISKYLDTSREIEELNDSISKLNSLLEEEENKRESYTSKNKILEEELLDSFNDYLSTSEYSNITKDNIEEQLKEINAKVKESKETLDITKESVDSLIENGINDDYNSYVFDAESEYITDKNKQIILNVYNTVIDILDDFKLIIGKREKIKSLLDDKELSEEVKISLMSFIELLDNQINILDNEKSILDNITNYNGRIKFKKERLLDLNDSLDTIEMLAIQREYGLINTYENENKEDIPSDKEEENILSDDILKNVELPSLEEETLVKQFYDPYRIVEIKDYPKTLNIGLAKLKAEAVRDKVNKKLNPDLHKTPIKEEEVASSEEKEEVPVWNTSTDVSDNLNNKDKTSPPVWEEIKPLLNIEDTSSTYWPDENKEDNRVLDIKPKQPDELLEDNINNIFWIPVSDDKLPANSFPEINTSSVNNNLNKDDFGFPDIN